MSYRMLIVSLLVVGCGPSPEEIYKKELIVYNILYNEYKESYDTGSAFMTEIADMKAALKKYKENASKHGRCAIWQAEAEADMVKYPDDPRIPKYVKLYADMAKVEKLMDKNYANLADKLARYEENLALCKEDIDAANQRVQAQLIRLNAAKANLINRS